MSTQAVYYKTDYNFSGTATPQPIPSTDLGNSFVPVGTILLYGGINLPTNYLWCDGSFCSTTTYSTLYSVIGNTYGGSGGNFSVPNMLKRFPIGANSSSNMTISYTGPDSNNTTKNGGNSLIVKDQLAEHNHNPPSGTDAFVTGYQEGTPATPGPRELDNANNSNYWINNKNGTKTGDVNALDQVEFLPPFTVVNYIIKYK